MGNSSSSAHDFTPNLTKLCGEGENATEKKQVRELVRGNVQLKGKFGSTGQGKAAKMKDNGIQVVVGVLGAKKLAPTSLMFDRIAKLSQIEDIHLSRLVGVVTTGSPFLFAYELCTMGDLRQYLDSQGSSLTPQTRLRIAADISDGLCSAETLSLVHGNLTLAAIFVYEGGNVFKVGNFFGEFAPADESLFAPEVRNGAAPTGQSDVYAFAKIVQTLFSGGIGHSDGEEGLGDVIDRCLSDEAPQRPDFFWLRADFEERASRK